jgi:aminoglycoside 3-N-acetyltransferase
MASKRASLPAERMLVTRDSLRADLAALGVTPGMILLVHSSLSSLGWVCGNAATPILALEDLLGPEGTLVMPTHTGDLSDPAIWVNPPVPEAWWGQIRATMPAYDPDLTPVWGVGAIPETFRKQRGTLRSAHPQLSFAAHGAEAEAIVGEHQLEAGLGEASPLARIYERGGYVLLLGVGYESNTSIHLAEYRADWEGRRFARFGAPLEVADERRWVEFTDLDIDNSDFDLIGVAFEQASRTLHIGTIGEAPARLMFQPELVDFAVAWMTKHRGRGGTR